MNTDELIRENKILRHKLEVSQRWMQRQIQESLHCIRESREHTESRKRFDNFFEDGVLESFGQRMHEYFGETLAIAPAHTLERLLDAEIHWNTLQKFPHMDAFALIISYQKILDSTFALITDSFHGKKVFLHMSAKGIETDIYQVFTKKYNLSLGRWYQVLASIRFDEPKGEYLEFFITEIESQFPGLLEHLTSDVFFERFEALIEMEVFSTKRHAKKVNFSDAKCVRDMCTRNFYEKDGLFFQLFSYLL